jgi:hypothetical protein
MTNVNKMEEEPSNDIFSAVFFSQKTILKLLQLLLFHFVYICHLPILLRLCFDIITFARWTASNAGEGMRTVKYF